jgi:hypothetical protein
MIGFTTIFLIIIAIIAVANAVKKNKYDAAKKEGRISDTPTKKCPQCAEAIQQEARVCRYCGFKIS